MHVDVAATEITDGYVRPFLSRRRSCDWERTFWAETRSADLIERLPDGWKDKDDRGRASVRSARRTTRFAYGTLHRMPYRSGHSCSPCATRWLEPAPLNLWVPPSKTDRSLNPVLQKVFAVDSASPEDRGLVIEKVAAVKQLGRDEDNLARHAVAALVGMART